MQASNSINQMLEEMQRAALKEREARSRRKLKLNQNNTSALALGNSNLTKSALKSLFSQNGNFGQKLNHEDKHKRGRGANNLNIIQFQRKKSISMMAGGFNPAVIKIVSYANGSTRATATANYIQKEGVQLETHNGILLETKDAITNEMKIWAKDFDKRQVSDDVSIVKFSINCLNDTVDTRKILENAVDSAFKGHRYVSQVSKNEAGILEAKTVLLLAGSSKERFRLKTDNLTDKTKFQPKSQKIIENRLELLTGLKPTQYVISPGKGGHGIDAASYRLKQLISNGEAKTNTGEVIKSESQIAQLSASWKRDLRSFTPRDTMHIILSTKSTTDLNAFEKTVRGFLHEEYADHKFAFAIHTDMAISAGHIHAHAIIAVKGEDGNVIRMGPADFSPWRERYAAKAQSEGIWITATRSLQKASSQSYKTGDKAIVANANTTREGREDKDRAYAEANPALIQQASRRLLWARENPVKIPMTETGLVYVKDSLQDWQNILTSEPKNIIAQENVERLKLSSHVSSAFKTLSGKVINLFKESEMPITSEQMKNDLNDMNMLVANTAAQLSGVLQQQFIDKAGNTLEYLAIATDLQSAKERGISTMTRAQLDKIAGAATERLISHSQQVASQDRQKAQESALLADRAKDLAGKVSKNPSLDPVQNKNVQSAQDLARVAQDQANRAKREADAATLAAQQIIEAPGRPLDSNLVTTGELQPIRIEQERVIEKAKEFESEKQKTKPYRQR